MTRVIMISRDAKVLDRESAVYERVVQYSNLFEHLDVIVLAKKVKTKVDFNTEKLTLYNMTGRVKVFAFLRALFFGIKLGKKLKKDGDVWITSQDPFESGFLAYVISRLSGIKLQVQIHTDCFNPLYFKADVGNYLRALMARFVISKADSIRVVSNRIRNSITDLNKDFKSKVFVLPVWFDVPKLQSAAVDNAFNIRNKFKEFEKIILVVARLEAEKNIDLTLFAFKKSLRFNPNLGLVIVGAGSKESWLKSLVSSLNIEKNVRFIGWVHDVGSLFKTADLLLVTSLYEGYGLTMVEAVACGCPVVATDVGIAKEVGAVIVPYDAGQIALTIVDVLKNQKKPTLKEDFIITKEAYLEGFAKTFKSTKTQ